MNKEDRIIHKHILKCQIKKCNECEQIYKQYFIDPSKKAIYKYQQTEKFKAYRKKYYNRNRDEILRKYHATKVLNSDIFSC